jgi:hypothetical protein
LYPWERNEWVSHLRCPKTWPFVLLAQSCLQISRCLAKAPSVCFHMTLDLLWTAIPTNTHFSLP